MDALSELLVLSETEKEARGLLYTPREIFQQPLTWQQSYQRILQIAPDVQDFLAQTGLNREIKDGPSVYLIGAGTSDYIGKSLTSLLREKWQCEVQAIPSTDLLTNMDDFILAERPYLWVSFSRSGDSSEGVAVLERALSFHPEIYHLIITCSENGRMAREFQKHPQVFCIVLDDEVNDRGLAMTSSFSNMVMTGQCLAHLSDLTGYRAILDRLVFTAQEFLPRAADLSAGLVEEGFSKVCFLGSGPLKAAAIESGLKVLELTAGRIVTFSESFLGVRHGPLSAIDDETLVVGYVSGDSRRRAYELDLLKEIRSKRLAKRQVMILPEADGVTETDLVDDAISLPFQRKTQDDFRPPVDVIFGQLLGLFSSLRLGLKPDTPSPKGAISRVVSQVVIH